jgi:hypothetical protein
LILEKRRDIKTALVGEIIGEGHCAFGLRQTGRWFDVGWILDLDFGVLADLNFGLLICALIFVSAKNGGNTVASCLFYWYGVQH